MTTKFCVIGAGFTGSIVAEKLAASGYQVDVYETRSHVAGNCYTYRDKDTGILVHKYGPHIFHTDSEKVWSYISQYSKFIPFSNKVKAVTGGKVYSLPINLHTINQVFGKTFSPSEAEEYISSLSVDIGRDPQTFKEQALAFVGEKIYKLFFETYTLKQWEIDPSDLPASILKRLPLRFNYNDNYFNHKYQVMPEEGYTPIVEKMLSSERINLSLETSFDKSLLPEYSHVFYTGPIDGWFDYKYGRLPYRTLDFRSFKSQGDFQGNAVINYCDNSEPFTRITEHKHFAPWETHEQTVCFKEFSRACLPEDEPYYPVRFAGKNDMLDEYLKVAGNTPKVSFMGRLGQFKYMDMDVTILSALNASEKILECVTHNLDIPSLFS